MLVADAMQNHTAGTGIYNMPIETLERILDFLHDSPIDLCSSSLVDHAWLSASRYHLFYPTTIYEFKTRYYEDMVENISSFLALVKAPECSFLPFIRKVVLNVTTSQQLRAVVEELRWAKSLTQVVFMDKWHISEPMEVAWIAQCLPGIQEFSYDAERDCRMDAFRLVTSFPHLRSLAIYTEGTLQPLLTLPTHISGSNFGRLRILRLRFIHSEQLLEWIQSLDGWEPELEVFDIRIVCGAYRGWGAVNALNRFLNANSRTLKELSIGIDHGPNEDDEDLSDRETKLNLGALSNLSTLTFRTQDIIAVCDALRSLNPDCELKKFSIRVLGKPYGTPDPPYEWSELLGQFASVLEGNEAFANFGALYVSVTPSLKLDAVSALFGRWAKRNALVLESYPEHDIFFLQDHQLNSRQALLYHLFKPGGKALAAGRRPTV